MRLLKIVLAFTLISLMGGCFFPGLMAAQQPVLVTVPPDATATPTPFLPLGMMTPTNTPFLPSSPSATPGPQSTSSASPSPIPPEITQTPVWGDYPGPTSWSPVEIPPPVDPLPLPAGQVNILLLGSDQRPYEGGFRTDTILLASLNPQNDTANLISFPRDLYVYIPGWKMQRINTAFAFGDFATMALTMKYNFGIRVDHYVLVNFAAFIQTVDSLGGIDVQVARTLTDHRDGYGNYTVYAGLVHMDGETALWYVRARYTTSDFDRARRQQEVLQALFKRFISLDAISRAPELFNIYRQNVTTDLTLGDITPLIPLADHLRDLSGVGRYVIGPEYVISWVVPYSGAMVLLPKREMISPLLRQALLGD